ncbi:MAG: DNA polymerase III subunit alpha [Chloroflexi bacterium]|nr:DNA polymerase III subunit alpha [Chloroflexota bacterium]
MSDFVHLHVHSEYSLLDGFSNIPKLVKRAKDIGMVALALTDHGTLFGVIDFYKAAKKEGIKPIIGIESYMAARNMADRDPEKDKRSTHLLLLAENQVGYQNLLKIATASQLEGHYYFPRIDHDFLAEHAEGLICTSGCMSGEIPRAILQDNVDGARKKLDWYYEVFGPENFFIELQNHEIKELPKLNSALLELGQRYQANYVATNDVHYIKAEDARLQDIMLCIQTGSLVSDPKRMRMTDQSYHLRTAQEMASLFSDTPGALKNSLLIAERCEVNLDRTGYHLPEFKVPEGYTTQTYLLELCKAGLKKRYNSRADDPEIRERLTYELEIINDMGFNAYFLIVWDLCLHAKEEGIWYNARGSAAGSMVAYCLDITLIDPIEHGLIFERFLNPDRISMPDIDLDFRDDMRYKMLEYCAQRYGEDKVAAIITFGKLKARAAVRDVGRVLDIPLSEVDKISKMIPNIPGNPVSIDQALDQVPELQAEYRSKSYVRELIDTARNIEGAIRNAGTHAAGVIITDRPAIEYIPLHRPTSGSAEDSPIKTVTQFEMSTVDDLGLLKVDFLGLATLTIMARACDLIKQRHNVDLDLHSIPTDDPKTYELLGNGDTAGVFQFEGSGMRRWMKEMKPTSLENAVAMVALYRPGPMEFIPAYIRRMHGEDETDYRHPSLEPLFKETFGIAVYQEQLMSAAMELAGYTGPEADDLRKAISKKLGDKIEKHRHKFIRGASEQGIPAPTAAEIFQDWENFARYGFNKSHAVDYGVIAVKTAYLKANYPIEYMTAVLSVSKNDTDKIAIYSGDCQRMGIELLPPDITTSDWDFSIADQEGKTPAIRFGLGAIKNVGKGPVDIILQSRGEDPINDLEEMARRIDLRHVGKRALECLIRVGALDRFGPRKALLQIMDRLVSISSAHFHAAEMGQISFFGSENGLAEEIVLPDLGPEDNLRERLNWERELVGLYLSDHPLNALMDKLEKTITHLSSELPLAEEGESVRVAGIVANIRHHQTKTGKSMAFVKLEDTQGIIDLVIFPRVWEKSFEKIVFDEVIAVDGKMDMKSAEPKILANKIFTDISKLKPLDKQKSPGPTDSMKQKQIVQQKKLVNHLAEDQSDYGLPSDMPPPPEPFPNGWDSLDEIPEFEENPIMPASVSALENPHSTSEPEKESTSPIEEPISTPPASEHPSPATNAAAQTHDRSSDISDEVEINFPDPFDANNPIIPKPNYIIPPTPTSDQSRPAAKMVTLFLRSSGDKARDVLRIRRIFGMLIRNPGNDRFAFYVNEKKQGRLLEFPNDTTGLNDELQKKLINTLGAENVRIEEITYQ